MHVVTGTMFMATAVAMLCASRPAEKEIGMLVSICSRNFFTRFMAITCSGGPDMYIVSSVKNAL